MAREITLRGHGGAFPEEGLYGATVLRGVAGYGSSDRFLNEKIPDLSEDVPTIIEVVEEERLEKILPRLDEMVDGGLITLQKAHVILSLPAASKEEISMGRGAL